MHIVLLLLYFKLIEDEGNIYLNWEGQECIESGTYSYLGSGLGEGALGGECALFWE